MKMGLLMLPFGTLLVALLCPRLLESQTSLKDPLAVDALARATIAMGATQGIVSSIVASGTYTRFRDTPITYALRLKARGFDRIRWETDLATGTVVTIIRDNLNGRVQQCGRTDAIPISRTAGGTYEALPVLALGDWLASTAVKARYLGLEKVAGKDYLRIGLNRIYVREANSDFKKAIEQITRMELYVDAISHLPYWLRYYQPLGDWRQDTAIDLIYSDFQRIGTVMIPMTISRFLNGKKISEIRFQSVTLNATIADSEF